MQKGPKIRIYYNHPNYGNHRVTGPATGEHYGYYGGGREFDVYEADVKRRPDLFIPVDKRVDQLKAQKEAIEAELAKSETETLGSTTLTYEIVEEPEELEEPNFTVLTATVDDGFETDSPEGEHLSNLDYPQGISSRQIIALSDANIDTAGQFMQYLEGGGDLTEIPGIAEASAKKLTKMVQEYLANA